MSLRASLSFFFLLFAVFIFRPDPHLQAEEIRTWSDSTGKFKIEAKFISETAEKVKLERADGKSVEISIKFLSEADQKYLKERASNPFKSTEEASPFMPVKEGTPPAKSAVGDNSPRGGPIDWSRSVQIDVESYGDAWNFQASGGGELDFVPKNVSLPVRSEFFEKTSRIAINRDARKAVVGYLWTFSTPNKQPRTRLVLCDLAKGQVEAEVTEVAEMVPLALHPDGQRVLMKSAERDKILLEIWSIRGHRVVRESAWNPKNEEWKSFRDEIQWAEFASETRLITKLGNGWVTIWDTENLQPVCHFAIEGGCIPALSADGKTLAFCKGERIGLLDVETQEVIAMQKTPRQLSWPNLALSPSQKRLACVALNSVLVWDVETGELYRDFEPSGLMINSVPQFPDDDFILLGNRYLVELENMIKLWDYEGGEQVKAVGGTTFFAVSPQNQRGALMPTLIPHESALTALNAALNEPDLFVFRKGSPVKLDVSGIPDPQRATVEQNLREKLSELQIQILPNAPVTVKASVSGPKTESMEYMRSGTYTVQVYRTSVELVYENQTIWQSSGSNIPHFVTLRQGENLGDVLREKSRGPAYEFYKSLGLPKFVQKPVAGTATPGQPASQTLGVSKVVPTTNSRKLPKGRSR